MPLASLGCCRSKPFALTVRLGALFWALTNSFLTARTLAACCCWALWDKVTPPLLPSSPAGSHVYRRSWESFRLMLWEHELYTDISNKNRKRREGLCVCVFGVRVHPCCNLMCVHNSWCQWESRSLYVSAHYPSAFPSPHFIRTRRRGRKWTSRVFWNCSRALSFLLWERKCQRLLI